MLFDKPPFGAAPRPVMVFLHGGGWWLRHAGCRRSVARPVAAERLIRPLTVIEEHLATHEHLVGTRFTVADLNMAEVVRYAQGYGALMGQFPAVEAWQMCTRLP